MTNRRKKTRKPRGLGHEPLENRSLLAGVAGCSPWQNPEAADDVNADGAVSPLDALVAINAMNERGVGPLSGRFAPPSLQGRVANALEHYVDANGDSQLTPLDALLIINALNSKQSGAPSGQSADDGPDNDANEPAEWEDTTSVDQQPETIGPDAPELILHNGFARVRSAINVDGDTDVFRLVPTQTQLAVTLVVPNGRVMQVSLVDADGNSLETVATDGVGRHARVTLNAAVMVGNSYYLVVTADAGVTGRYCLGVMNYDPNSFPPLPDAPPGDGHHDEHDDRPEPPGPPTAEDLFQKLDTTSDGSLTVDELQALPAPPHVTIDWTAIFAELDANGDGAVTLDEFAAGLPPLAPLGRPHAPPNHGHDGWRERPGHGASPPPRLTPEETFAEIDTDADGLVTLEEMEAQARAPRLLAILDRIFAAWDVDDSGALTVDEFTMGMSAKA